ncbi:MAG: quinone oxidoreductase [Dinoroseobacter sp.]|nr:quinone oxidoreductase [Dinoroseobacter sp.]
MKAMILTEYGETAPFEVAELRTPAAKPGHVVVRVAATSVNTVDTMIRSMGHDLAPLAPTLPAVLGMDFAGTVEAVGDGVEGLAVGDEVYGCAGGLSDLQGALAEYMLADARLVAHKPKSLSMREAAAIPLVGITAYEGLTRAGVGMGQKVLVHGGAGGVGHLAVQIAAALGAQVYSTGHGEEQLDVIRNYGATAIDFQGQSVAEYVKEYTDDAGFNVVFDSVGGANLTNSFEAAAINGHVATTVAMTELDLTPAHFKGLSLHVVFMLIPMLHNFQRDAHGKILAKLAELVDAGKLTPLLDQRRFDLAQAGDAHARLTGGNAIGKVVIDVS